MPINLVDRMRGDMIFAEYVTATARQRDGTVLVVDGSAPVEATAELAGRHFGLTSAPRSPGAQDRLDARETG